MKLSARLHLRFVASKLIVDCVVLTRDLAVIEGLHDTAPVDILSTYAQLYETSSSAIAERPRDAHSTLNRKPILRVVGHFEAKF